MAAAPFTYQEALDAGISPGRLRHRSLEAPSRGIRVPGRAASELLASTAPRIRPYTLVTEFSAASHASAFRLWEFPGFLPGSDGTQIHISRPDSVAIPRRAGVRGHRGQFFADEIVSLNGLLITSRTRTWLDCTRKMSIEELTVVADHLLRVPRPEFEGHSEPTQIVRDIAREEDFSRAGWILVRISKRHMENEARSAVAKVRRALLSRGWSPN